MTRGSSPSPAVLLAASLALFLPVGLHADGQAVVTVHSELPFARPSETIELAAAALAPVSADLDKVHVFDAGSAREVVAQTLDLDGDGKPESLIFQADVPASGERTFELRAGERRTVRKEDFRVYGRFVRERFDDFAWENDRTAHRIYGAALETWQREPLTSSAVDIWLKRTRRLVINDWYMTDDYHHDNGEGGDFYSAGSSRGCGGNGLWRDGKLLTSKNFRESRVLAAGPIRLVFELRYPVWDAAGVRTETKRISLDAGQNLSRFESRYDLDGAGVLYAIGIKKQAGADYRADREGGWMRTWEPVKGGKGHFGCAVVLSPAAIADLTEADGNYLITARTPAAYWAGAGWDQSGDFAGSAEWDRYVAQWAQRLRSPLRIEVRNR